MRSMTKSNSTEDPTLNDAALNPKVLETIGRALKAHYDVLVHAPLPVMLLDLLAQLEKKEQREELEEKPDASS